MQKLLEDAQKFNAMVAESNARAGAAEAEARRLIAESNVHAQAAETEARKLIAESNARAQTMETEARKLIADSNARAETAEVEARRLARQLEGALMQHGKQPSETSTLVPIQSQNGKGREPQRLQSDPYDAGDESDSDDADEVNRLLSEP